MKKKKIIQERGVELDHATVQRMGCQIYFTLETEFRKRKKIVEIQPNSVKNLA